MKNKVKSNKVSKKKFILALAVFILLMLILSPLKKKLQELVGFKEKDLKLVASVALDGQEDIKAKSYKDKIIIVEKEAINCYDYENKKLWSKSLKEHDEVYLGRESVFVNSKENQSIIKSDLNGEDLWSHTIERPTYTLTEIDDYLFIYSKVDESTRSVTILDNNGKLVLDKEKSKEEILSSNISKNKKNFIIASMDTSTPELMSKLTYLKYNGETIWTEEVKDKIIYNVLFLNDKNMLLIGDKEIICKNDKGETLWERQMKYTLKDIEITENSEIYTLYGNEDSYLEILKEDGELDYSKTFKKQYSNIEQHEGHMLLMGKDGVLGLNNRNISMKNDLKDDIKHIEKVEDEILIFKADKLDIFEIIDKETK